jgi:Ala-tRNA(Pro) deacylase
MTPDELCGWLAAHGIAFDRFDHPPVFTCEEADRLVPAAARAVQTKNLFLRSKKGDRHWLLVTDCRKPVDLKALGPVIGAEHLSLGSPDRLQRYLGLTPGSVTIFGLVNDPDHAVSVVIDEEIDRLPAWRCHPMVNSATLVVPREGLARFLALTGHQAKVVRVPTRRER